MKGVGAPPFQGCPHKSYCYIVFQHTQTKSIAFQSNLLKSGKLGGKNFYIDNFNPRLREENLEWVKASTRAKADEGYKNYVRQPSYGLRPMIPDSELMGELNWDMTDEGYKTGNDVRQRSSVLSLMTPDSKLMGALHLGMTPENVMKTLAALRIPPVAAPSSTSGLNVFTISKPKRPASPNDDERTLKEHLRDPEDDLMEIDENKRRKVEDDCKEE